MDKATFIEDILSAREEWETLMSQVGEDRMLEPGLPGGWPVKDVIGHISWCEREMLGFLQARALVGSDLWQLSNDERNAIVVAQNRPRSLHDILSEEQQVYTQLLQAIQQLSEEELNNPQCFRDLPAEWLPWKLLAGNLHEHYHAHMQPIREWLAATN